MCTYVPFFMLWKNRIAMPILLSRGILPVTKIPQIEDVIETIFPG